MQQPINSQRRQLLAGALAAATLSSTVHAADQAHKKSPKHLHGAVNRHTALIDSALDCIEKGERCIEHCTRLVAAGDTSIAECMRKVNETLPMCQALIKLGVYDSDHLAPLAKVCIDVCGDCEKECLKHADQHRECQACADSCVACIKECEKITV